MASSSPTIDLFLKLGFHGACCIYAILAYLCAFWGAATIPDNRGKSLVKVEEFYENKTKNPIKMNIWKYIIVTNNHARFKVLLKNLLNARFISSVSDQKSNPNWPKLVFLLMFGSMYIFGYSIITLPNKNIRSSIYSEFSI